MPTTSIRKHYEQTRWNDPNEGEALKKWQRGLTGYPMVDAGMRELYHSGTNF